MLHGELMRSPHPTVHRQRCQVPGKLVWLDLLVYMYVETRGTLENPSADGLFPAMTLILKVFKKQPSTSLLSSSTRRSCNTDCLTQRRRNIAPPHNEERPHETAPTGRRAPHVDISDVATPACGFRAERIAYIPGRAATEDDIYFTLTIPQGIGFR